MKAFTYLIGAIGFLLISATTSQAVVYNSLAAWNDATSSVDFAVSSPNVAFQFFGVCPFKANGQCHSTNDTDGPFAANANVDTTEAFITANTSPTWQNVDLIDAARQDPPSGLASDGKSGTLTSDKAYNLWVLKFDNALIALLFKEAVTSITFSGLENALSHLDLGSATYVNNAPPDGEVPLPAALPLLGGGIAILGILGLRKRRATKA